MPNIICEFEKIVQRFPQKKAVSFRDNSYTFEELKSKAQQIARTIKKLNVVNQPIVVLAERDITTVSGFLGVLYSGNYYVPVDPEMPIEKISAIVEDSCAKWILGSSEYADRYNEYITDCGYVSLDEAMLPEVGLAKDDNLIIIEKKENNPLYLVYTSGSTGKPKGVLKSHEAQLDFIENYKKEFGFTEDEIIGNQTPFFFDASAKDLYMTLLIGCTLEILPSTLFTLPPELIDYLNEKRVTFISWVPSALSIVAQLNPFSLVVPKYLRRVFFVGEVMPMKHLNIWRKTLPQLEYVNLYGQSEIAGICCYYRVQGEFENTDTLPIGKPLHNTQLYLVDKLGNVINDPGVQGELYVVNKALAMGYFNNEKSTAESFCRKDFGNGPERAFKTGDYASLDESGNYIFASRQDFQIKHMGHRIELGEIETVLMGLKDVARCCCLYDSNKKRIVLFAELVMDSELSMADIRTYLKEKLSNYMVPGKIQILESLPLNANGKIDRQELKKMM